MTVECLLDANVLIYAASRNPGERHKAQRAAELMLTRRFSVSAQVLQEFFTTVTRKAAIALSPADAFAFIQALDPVPCVPTDRELVKRGIAIAAEFQISYWDGAVIAAAERLGATTLYTEDLNHGQRYGAVTVINPFRVGQPG